MGSSHEDCIHHSEHDKSITRNEKDIQDIFDMIGRLETSIGKLNTQVAVIVTGITLLGKLIDMIIKSVGA